MGSRRNRNRSRSTLAVGRVPENTPKTPAREEQVRPKKSTATLVAVVLLTLLSLAAFWPVLSNAFIFYDDDQYVTANPPVRAGLSWSGVRWAFTTGHASNWHPLTWLSHMLDMSLFGMTPHGHHATSLLLHVANTLLLFLLLRRFTGTFWRSAAVAALFAVHPLHVESVAWVAERKDVLSTLFWLTTMLAYWWYVRRPGARRYAVVLLSFAAGLMTKPMVVTLPLVLLLVDYWPLGRFATSAAPAWLFRRVSHRAGIVLEKAPLFAMSAAAGIVTFLVQRAGGAVGSLEKFPLRVRIANAIVAFLRYIEKLLWPAGLAVFYPHPGRSLSGFEVAAAAVVLALLFAAAVRYRRRGPYLLVGLGWFAITLAPVIGVVQVGVQAMADRYAYIPSIGFFLAVVWGVADLAGRRRFAASAVRVALPAALLSLGIATFAQARRWKNSETLFRHAMAVTPNNYLARVNLGNYYNESGRPAEAIVILTEVVRARPENATAHLNRGHSLFLLGRLDEAVQEFSESQRLNPKDPVSLNNLGWTRGVQGELGEAVRFYERAVALAPNEIEFRERLANVLLLTGHTVEARRHVERAAALAPNNAEYQRLLAGVSPSGAVTDGRLTQKLAAGHRQAALALKSRGKKSEALEQLRAVVALRPSSWEARSDLGALLGEMGDFDAATAELREALRLNPTAAVVHNDLGYLFSLQGKLEPAIREYERALEIQPDLALAKANLGEALRRRNRTFRERETGNR